MLTRVLAYIEAHREEELNSLRLCEVFGLSIGMAERLIEALEDAGHLALERAGGGGCSSGGCSSGGCSTKGPASAINALAEAARGRKAGVT